MLSELVATHHLVNTVIQLARDIICVNQGDTYGLPTRPSRQMLHLSYVSDNDMRL